MPLPALVLKPLVGLAPPLEHLETVVHDNSTGVIQPLLACLEPHRPVTWMATAMLLLLLLMMIMVMMVMLAVTASSAVMSEY